MVGDERIEVDPRRAFRERKKLQAEGAPVAARVGDPPPSLLGPDRVGGRIAKIRSISPEPEDGPDPYDEAVKRLRVRPGNRRNGRAGVRLYHVLPDARADDLDARCWAFTITRSAYERLVTERVLDSEGATYPDGRPCVPPGIDPLDVPIRCGSCGTTSVETLQIELWED